MTASSIIAIFKPLAQPAQRFIGLLKIRARERHYAVGFLSRYTHSMIYSAMFRTHLPAIFGSISIGFPGNYGQIFFILYGCAVERARVVIF
jgi:hypothetical protein